MSNYRNDYINLTRGSLKMTKRTIQQHEAIYHSLIHIRRDVDHPLHPLLGEKNMSREEFDHLWLPGDLDIGLTIKLDDELLLEAVNSIKSGAIKRH